VAGRGPVIHVFGAEIVAVRRRGCPGRARTTGSWKQSSVQGARLSHPSHFPPDSRADFNPPDSGRSPAIYRITMISTRTSRLAQPGQL